MSLFTKKALLGTFTPFLQPKRFRGKINIQKPRAPHYERAKYLALIKPFFASKIKHKTPAELCTLGVNLYKKDTIVNPYEQILARELREKFEQSRLIAFFHLNSMKGDVRFKAYAAFHKQNMLMKQYGKQTLRMAIEDSPYKAVLQLYVSQNMMVFSPEPEVKKLLAINRKFPQIVLLAGILEGRFFSKEELVRYSAIPDLQTAQAQLVQTLNSAGSHLVSQLNAHPNTLVSQLSERAKQLEDEK